MTRLRVGGGAGDDVFDAKISKNSQSRSLITICVKYQGTRPSLLAGRTRGHSLKLVKCRYNKDIRKFFLSHRAVSKWNIMLDNDSATAKTVNGFRTRLERERAKKTGLFLD